MHQDLDEPAPPLAGTARPRSRRVETAPRRLGQAAAILTAAALSFSARSGGRHGRALAGLGTLVMLLALAPLLDAGLQGVVEKAGVAVGALVWCQVQAYARGGRFNPVAGLSIPIFGLGGLARLVTIAGEPELLALIGSLGVAAAGALAGGTLFVAMRAAVQHGQAKKAAAVEARHR